MSTSLVWATGVLAREIRARAIVEKEATAISELRCAALCAVPPLFVKVPLAALRCRRIVSFHHLSLDSGRVGRYFRGFFRRN